MRKPRFNSHKLNLPYQQTGAALLLFVLLLVVGATTLLVSKMNKAAAQYYRDEVTMKALLKAKEALIGYAVSYPDLTTTTVIEAGPGYLPCSDRSDPPNGSPNSCGSYDVGRLPWEFIGVDEIRDSAGELLWYVMADDFKNASTKHFPINSETVADLTVDGVGDVVAVIIAPGFSISGQNRPSSTPSDYLEGENKNGDAIFVSEGSDEFNDQLITITRQELMAAVEKRVMGDVAKINRRYSSLYDTSSTHFGYLSRFRKPKVGPSLNEANVQAITGIVTTGGTNTLTDNTKNFSDLGVEVGDLVHVYNSARSEPARVTATPTGSSLTLAPIATGLPVTTSAGENYTVSRFNGNGDNSVTQGSLAILSDQEVFQSPAQLSWTGLNGTLSECSQLDSSSLPENEASRHIEELRSAINQQATLSVNNNDNVCIWTNENEINCEGIYSAPVTVSGTSGALAVNPCDAGAGAASASDIITRLISYRLKYVADQAGFRTVDLDSGLIGEKIRTTTKTFNSISTLTPVTEVIIEDLSNSGEVLGRIRLVNPSAGTISFEQNQLDLSTLSGYAESGSGSTLVDSTKEFLARGVKIGDWVELVVRLSDGSIDNDQTGNRRGIITSVQANQIGFDSKGTTPGTALDFSLGDEYRIYNEFPKWFTYNNWHHLNYLAYAQEMLPGGTGTCTNCLSIGVGDDISTVVPGNDNKQALVISAGAPLSTQDRSSGTLSDYYENGNSSTTNIFDRGAFNSVRSLFNDQVKRVAPCTPGNEIHECY